MTVSKSGRCTFFALIGQSACQSVNTRTLENIIAGGRIRRSESVSVEERVRLHKVRVLGTWLVSVSAGRRAGG